MNAGASLTNALNQAHANAKSSGVPWSVVSWRGNYWIDKLHDSDFDGVDRVVMPDGSTLVGAAIKNLKVLFVRPRPATEFYIRVAKELSDPAITEIQRAVIYDDPECFFRSEFIRKDGLTTQDRRSIIIVSRCPEGEREKKAERYNRMVTEILEKRDSEVSV